MPARPAFIDYAYRIYSQSGEDGLLLYLFSRLGVTSCFFVEFGTGSGMECNSANLSLNFGWSGLLMDCCELDIARARRYYEKMLGPDASRLRFQVCAVTAENINAVLRGSGVPNEIDLLSIDIDGNDYWVWNAIGVTSPRVVVIEYNALLGAEVARTVRYDPGGQSFRAWPGGLYAGASLAALTALGWTKGYSLVGCTPGGVNAFFVRSDLVRADVLEVSPTDAFEVGYQAPAGDLTHAIAALPFQQV